MTRTRLERLADRRRLQRDRAIAAPALLLVLFAVLRSETAAWLVGGLLAYTLLMAAAWALGARLLRGWGRLGWHVQEANRRAAEVPEPASNLLYATTTDTRRPDPSA